METLGIIQTDLGCEHLAVSISETCSLALAISDLRRHAGVNFVLMVAVSDCAGPHAALPYCPQVRRNSQTLGDPHVAAALHIFFAETETKRGLLQSATKHVVLGRRLNTGTELLA